MTGRWRRLPTRLAGGCVVMVSLSGMLAAWACVPGTSLAGIILQPRSSGAVGSEITIEGLNFLPDKVEIRWNALDGDRLVTATGPDFTSTATIPSAPAGLYTVLAVSRRPDGSVADIVRAPFQVTSADGPVSTVANDTKSPVERPQSSTGWLVAGVAGMLLMLPAGIFLRRRRAR